MCHGADSACGKCSPKWRAQGVNCLFWQDKVDEYRRNWLQHLNATKPNAFEIILLQTTWKENNWKTEETLERAAVTLETERTTRSNPWCLWWWWWWWWQGWEPSITGTWFVLRRSPCFNSAEVCIPSLVFMSRESGEGGIDNNGKRNFGTPVVRSRVFCIQLYRRVPCCFTEPLSLAIHLMLLSDLVTSPP